MADLSLNGCVMFGSPFLPLRRPSAVRHAERSPARHLLQRPLLPPRLVRVVVAARRVVDAGVPDVAAVAEVADVADLAVLEARDEGAPEDGGVHGVVADVAPLLAPEHLPVAALGGLLAFGVQLVLCNRKIKKSKIIFIKMLKQKI